MYSILIVDDDSDFLETYKRVFKNNGYDVDVSNDPCKVAAMLEEKFYDVVLTDIVMPKMNGLELLRHVKENDDNQRVIVFSGEGSIDTAVEAMKLGAFSYLSKPIDIEKLFFEVSKCIEVQALTEEKEYYKAIATGNETQLIFECDSSKQLYRELLKIAPTDSSVMITGESGTGKELLADLIHKNSRRAKNAMIKVNCSELSPGVLESELFGHEKGAFTGAVARKKGRFELADQGTLFLDEICEMSHEMQVKLLRTLQQKEFYRVGGSNLIKTDFRLITATNKNPAEEVKKGNFREDLFYRINVLPIKILPLRERRHDIMPLVRYYMEKISRKNGVEIPTVTSDVNQMLTEYYWPGNVRELVNIVERLLVYSENGIIDAESLPIEISRSKSHFEEYNQGTLREAVNAFEEGYIRKKFISNKNNVSATARELGIARNNLYVKLKKFNIL